MHKSINRNWSYSEAAKIIADQRARRRWREEGWSIARRRVLSGRLFKCIGISSRERLMWSEKPKSSECLPQMNL